MHDAVTAKMPREAHRMLKIIAALTGDTMFDVCLRLFSAELERVRREDAVGRAPAFDGQSQRAAG